MTKLTPHNLIVVCMLTASLSAQEPAPIPNATLNVFPNAGEAAAMCSADVPGRWAVWSSSLGEPLTEGITILELKNDNTLCVFTAPAGKYVFQFVPNDYTVPFAYAKVVLGGGPKPDPDPDPDPDPPKPGPRTVIIISEESDTDAYRELAISGVASYVNSNPKHKWGLYDPDQKDQNGNTAAWLQDYLDAAKGVGYPALLVIAEENGKEFVSAVPFPDSGDSIAEGEAAKDAAIAAIKELGG